MAETRTRLKFVTDLMRDMGVLDTLSQPRAEDAKYLIERYENIMSELRDDNLVYWDDDAIPREVFEALIVFFKLMVGPSYGLPGLTVNLDSALESAKVRIRRRTHKEPSNEPIGSDYF
jgi:hypothetical protein